jgi:hypothetical protein
MDSAPTGGQVPGGFPCRREWGPGSRRALRRTTPPEPASKRVRVRCPTYFLDVNSFSPTESSWNTFSRLAMTACSS